MFGVRTLLLSFMVSSIALAGCLGAEDEAGARGACSATATGAMKVANSWAYDASELRAATGDLTIDVDESDNDGTTTGTATESSGAAWEWDVAFTNFTGSQPFHDGGVTRDLTEHGDSNVGDKNIPKVRLECAGWGPVTVNLNGAEITEDDVGLPLTGHFMVSSTGVRDDATGKILAANGTTPYSPARPGDAARSPGDYEFWLVARTPASDEPPTIPPLTFADTVTMANYERRWDFNVLSPANIDVAAAARNQAAGPVVGQVTVTLRDPAGGAASSATLGGTGQTTMGGLTLDNATAGPYALVVTGNGVGLAYTLTVTIEYPNGFLLVLFWEEGTIDA